MASDIRFLISALKEQYCDMHIDKPMTPMEMMVMLETAVRHKAESTQCGDGCSCKRGYKPKD